MKIDGYKILEKIGQGGMAQVYKGYQLSLKRPVAIKMLTHHFVDQPDFAQRFNKESLIIARLSNPYIIPVIERGISSEGIPYFIMEYVEGHDLSSFMAKGQLDFNRKLDIVSQICKALSLHTEIILSTVILNRIIFFLMLMVMPVYWILALPNITKMKIIVNTRWSGP